MLEVKNLRKTFGAIRAVNDVSFNVERGEVLGFLGPNGAGKTTTMRMITGFLPPTSGTAIVNGFDIRTSPLDAKKQIGYLPENAPVYSEMTVFNYLRFIAEIRGFTGAARDARVGGTVEKCRLDGVRNQSIGTLSKGYRQRVCFAQALLHDPAVLIMDEPTDGLDPNQKRVVRDMIRDMAREKVIVLSTHILEEVDAVCSRAVIISHGRIAANASPDSLRRRSAMHGAVEILLDKPLPEAATLLRSLPSAASVQEEGGRFVVMAKDKDRLFHDVFALVKGGSWAIGGIRVLDGRLDDVFRDLTMNDNGTARPESAA